MKKILTLILALCMIFGAVSFAFASVQQVSKYGELYFEGVNCHCYGYSAENGASIEMTMKLYRNGRSVRTWTASGTNRVEMLESYPAVSGSTYQLTFTCYVNGSQVSIPTVTSVCP